MVVCIVILCVKQSKHPHAITIDGTNVNEATGQNLIIVLLDDSETISGVLLLYDKGNTLLTVSEKFVNFVTLIIY